MCCFTLKDGGNFYLFLFFFCKQLISIWSFHGGFHRFLLRLAEGWWLISPEGYQVWIPIAEMMFSVSLVALGSLMLKRPPCNLPTKFTDVVIVDVYLRGYPVLLSLTFRSHMSTSVPSVPAAAEMRKIAGRIIRSLCSCV